MDLGDADELDYEEDEPANNFVETDPQNENLSGSEDQYLQIDCPEEIESLFSYKEPADDVSMDTQNVKEAGSEEKESKNPSPQNSSSGVEQVAETSGSNSDANNGVTTTTTPTTNTIPTITKTTNYKKKRSNLFRRRPDMNEKIFNFSNVSPPLPELSFGVAKTTMNRYSVCANLQDTLNRGFYPNQNLFSPPQKNLQPLMSIKSKAVPFPTLSSFSPIGVPKKCNLIRRRNKFMRRHCSWPSFNNNHSKFQINNKKITPDNVERKNGAFEQKTNNMKRKNLYFCNENFQTVETQRNLKNRTFHDQSIRSTGSGVKLNECGFGKKNNNSTLDLQYNFMKPDEKELVSLKKEARLKRFCNDEMVRKEKIPIESGVDEKYKEWTSENLEKEYFQKMAEQKLTRERFFTLKGQRRRNCYSDQNFQIEKPNINKESLLEKRNPFDSFARFKNFSNFQIEKPNINKDTLLKKRNPFDENSKTPKLSLGTEIKKESETCKEVKKEHFGDKSVGSVKIDSQLIKDVVNNMTSLASAGQSFCDVKNETKSPVKFVRTVSKCFGELALKKPKPDVIIDKNTNELPFSNKVQSFPSLEKNKMNTLIIQDFPAQIESQLTGCIVKVLNIPPTTTTNDVLALCCPIGMVREVKLNSPKENSVVIRFVEPACAEKFFSLYHGQKMNNYFLNVIIV